MVKQMMAVLLLCVAGTITGNGSEQGFKIVSRPDGFLLQEDGKNVFFYQRKAKANQGKFGRSHYFHPLFGLNGEVLTEDSPPDHRHHHGIFWGWHQVFVGDKRLGDGWTIRDIEWQVDSVKTVQLNRQEIALLFAVRWQSANWHDSTGRMKPFVREQTLVRVHRETEGVRIIDFEIALLALEKNVRIGGSEDDKGYGGFSLRIKMPPDLEFFSASGPVHPQRTQLDAGPWMDFRGTFSDKFAKSGLLLICHPDNPNYPQPWILRQKRSMQNVVFPGRKTVVLPTEQPLRLRYRLVLHRKSAIDAEKLLQDFKDEPPFQMEK